MEIATAQAEIRRAYMRGGPGACVSGVVWLVAAVVGALHGVPLGFACLFFGGMLIFPIGNFLVRTVFRRAPAAKENPGGLTVIETVFPMIGGLFAAYLLIPHRPEFVFPLSAIAVGAHYFGFRSAYGDWTNWVLGGLLCALGVVSIILGVPQGGIVPYLVAGIEIAFGVWLTVASLQNTEQA